MTQDYQFENFDGLPDYQNQAGKQFNALFNLMRQYCDKESHLSADDIVELKRLDERFSKLCEETLRSCKPKIMLFGVYNAGKSTLLNGLMGEEKASIADKPETYKIDKYQWRGYELFDTPGLDAPIEHEMLSKATLAECQVVIFVVRVEISEDKKVYESLAHVYDRRKKLILVLNETEGNGLDSENVRMHIQQVDKLLEQVGLADISSSIHIINAQDAFIGRLEKEDSLIAESQIEKLETAILEEVRRTEGFAVLRDLIREISLQVANPFRKMLVQASGEGDNGFVSDFSSLRTECREFRQQLVSGIESECSGLTRKLFNALPEPGTTISQQDIQGRWKDILETQDQSLNDWINHSVADFSEEIFDRLKKLENDYFKEFTFQEKTILDQSATEGIIGLLNRMPQLATTKDIVERSSSNTDSTTDNMMKKIGATLAILPPLPIPIAVPIKVVGTILMFLGSLFGGGSSSGHDAALERQASAERAAQEEHARNMARWRRELQESCAEIHNNYVRNKKNSLTTWLHTWLDGILAEVQHIYEKKTQCAQQMLRDIATLDNMKSAFVSLEDELRSVRGTVAGEERG